MEKQEIVQLVKEQLPALLEESPELERWIERLTAQRYANRQQTESRFDQLLGEHRRDREEQSLKWATEDIILQGDVVIDRDIVLDLAVIADHHPISDKDILAERTSFPKDSS